MKLHDLIITNKVFEQLITPLSIEIFFEKYLLKQPLLIKGITEKFVFLPDKEEILSISENADSIRAVFKELKQIDISHEKIVDMFSIGATICITGLENAHNQLFQLCKSVKCELGFNGRVSLRAYWSPKGAGFSKHWDPRMVTTLQIEGNKKWYYAQTPYLNFPKYNSPYPLTEEMESHLNTTVVHCIDLSPGDFLCLPPGVIHWAEAQSETSFAYNLAFDYIGNNVVETVLNILKNRLNENSNLQAPLFGVGKHYNKEVKKQILTAVDWIKNELKHMPNILSNEYQIDD